MGLSCIKITHQLVTQESWLWRLLTSQWKNIPETCIQTEMNEWQHVSQPKTQYGFIFWQIFRPKRYFLWVCETCDTGIPSMKSSLKDRHISLKAYGPFRQGDKQRKEHTPFNTPLSVWCSTWNCRTAFCLTVPPSDAKVFDSIWISQYWTVVTTTMMYSFLLTVTRCMKQFPNSCYKIHVTRNVHWHLLVQSSSLLNDLYSCCCRFKYICTQHTTLPHIVTLILQFRLPKSVSWLHTRIHVYLFENNSWCLLHGFIVHGPRVKLSTCVVFSIKLPW